jgi:hypothetical protein
VITDRRGRKPNHENALEHNPSLVIWQSYSLLENDKDRMKSSQGRQRSEIDMVFV